MGAAHLVRPAGAMPLGRTWLGLGVEPVKGTWAAYRGGNTMMVALCLLLALGLTANPSETPPPISIPVCTWTTLLPPFAQTMLACFLNLAFTKASQTVALQLCLWPVLSHPWDLG